MQTAFKWLILANSITLFSADAFAQSDEAKHRQRGINALGLREPDQYYAS